MVLARSLGLGRYRPSGQNSFNLTRGDAYCSAKPQVADSAN